MTLDPKIVQRYRKVQALADRGEANEAANARAILERLETEHPGVKGQAQMEADAERWAKENPPVTPGFDPFGPSPFGSNPSIIIPPLPSGAGIFRRAAHAAAQKAVEFTAKELAGLWGDAGLAPEPHHPFQPPPDGQTPYGGGLPPRTPSNRVQRRNMATTPKEIKELLNDEVEATFETGELEDDKTGDVEACVKLTLEMPEELWHQICKSKDKAKAFVDWCDGQLDQVEEESEEGDDDGDGG